MRFILSERIESKGTKGEQIDRLPDRTVPGPRGPR
jgi:hypothetical protein